jgi:hypothetical protein
MMKTITTSLFLLGNIGSTIAIPTSLDASFTKNLRFDKRTLIYSTTPSCTPFWLGQGEKAKSQVCLSVSASQLVVTFKDVDNYDYKEVQLWLGCAPPTETSPGQLGAALKTYCVVASDKQTATCTIPVAAIPSCSAELCNRKLYIATHGALTGPSEETGWGMGTCINTGLPPASSVPICPNGNWAQYWDFTITCTEPEPVPEPPKVWCEAGTAFGYISPQSSPTLDTLGLKTCNRWVSTTHSQLLVLDLGANKLIKGWYVPTTLSAVKNGLSGKLIVGAGNNDISKGAEAGTFSISAPGGVPTVQYVLKPTYDLSEAHIYAACNTKPTVRLLRPSVESDANEHLDVCPGIIYMG